ncbi:glycopeptide antibiotics resistance protein [Stackebrandtia albiflava]|uniref:Glycopeptide antibiotics resistance protein n=1 Tax=Stackebrandtia albiflava TaxID=406432 RepID=A0A562UQ86_9ACTN|nr:VanZ family protein [Stackebrandtia albiflava]TWJ07783.1 glycopeptide antibiotics resistance protein [Stackebrandtia albiflava]
MSVPEKNPPRPDGRALRIGMFAIYLVLLTWIVLWKLEVPYIGGGELRLVKWVPFVPGSGADGSAPLEAVANVLFFVPFGLYLGLLAPSWRWWRTAATVAGASLLLEAAQYVLALGSSDVTDLITNTAGGLAGFGLFVLARRRLRARTVPVMTRVCVIGTVVILLLSGIVVASPLRYAPPRDAASTSEAYGDPLASSFPSRAA